METVLGRSALLVSSAIVCCVAASPALAQAHGQMFNVPSQAAETAIPTLGRQANVQVLAARKVTAGKRTNAVRGAMSVEQALTQMLAGTGLTMRQTGPQTFTILQQAQMPALSRVALTPAAVTKVASLQATAAPEPAAPVAAPEPVAAAEPPAQQEIVVTGSRLATGFAMPTPVTVLSADDLQKTAPANLAESLQQLPAMSGSLATSSSGRGSATSQTNGQSTLNLRNLGAPRTLVLFNGQRLGPANVNGTVDTNIIPQALIQRVDVVTGGASASYGSDAVTGVVNFILDTRFQGLKLSASHGVTWYNDVPTTSLSAAFGTSIGDRARIVASAELFRSKGIDYGLTGRDWLDHPVGVWNNPVAGASPTVFALPDAQQSGGTYGGLITAVGNCGTAAAGAACRALGPSGAAGSTRTFQQFVDGGFLAPFILGPTDATNYCSGCGGPISINGISPDQKRESLFAHGEFDLTSNITAWIQGTYGRNWTEDRAQPPRQNAATVFRIFEGNPFLPAAVASAFAAAPGTQNLSLGRYDIDWPLVTVLGVTTVKRGAVGLKGSLSETWKFDAGVAYQKSHQVLDIYQQLERRVSAASDAVRHPTTGQTVCYSNWFTPSGTFVPAGTGQDPGCVPINLFGPNTANPASTAWIMQWNTADIYLKQTSAELNLRGDLFGLDFGAGPLSTAVGGAWRKLDVRRVVDPLSNANIDMTGLRVCNATSVPACPTATTVYPASLQGRYGSYQFYNPSAFAGETTVYEGYAELGVPILRDVPFFKSLDATLAGRYTHYSQSGWEPTWKLGLNWTVDPNVRFRGTYSQDSRAPSAFELFNTATASVGQSIVPCETCNPNVRSTGQNLLQGNSSLRPEKARTLTAGVVFSPTFLSGFQASVDYYKIKISGGIAVPGTQNIVNFCNDGDQSFCDLITLFSNGVSTPLTPTLMRSFTNPAAPPNLIIINPTLNLGSESHSGLDLEVLYRTRLAGGNLRLRGTGVRMLNVRYPSGCSNGTANEVGSIGGCAFSYPTFRGSLSANWDVGKFGIFVQQRYISGGKKNKTWTEGVQINENDVPAIWYTDLNLTLRLGKVLGGESEVFFNVTNLFDQDPPPTLTGSRSWIEPTDNSIYDLLGRRFVAGMRFRL